MRAAWLVVVALVAARCAGAAGGGGAGDGAPVDAPDVTSDAGRSGAADVTSAGDGRSDGSLADSGAGDGWSDGSLPDSGAGDGWSDGSLPDSGAGDGWSDGSLADSGAGDGRSDGSLADSGAGDGGSDGSLPDSGAGDGGSDGSPADSGAPDAAGPQDAGADAADSGDSPPGCSSDAGCDDGDACTTDGCTADGCVHAFVPCDDGSLCTLDGCDPLAGCFALPVTCDDGDPCTLDSCDPATSLCVAAPAPCDDGDPCTADSCDPASGCVHVPGPCCSTDAGCDDGDPCTADSCAEGVCAHAPIPAAGCCDPAPYADTFDDGQAQGWTFTATGAAGWQVVPPSGPAASPVLWFGDPATGGFDVGHGSGEATSPPFTVPASVESALTFSLLMDTEPGAAHDVLVVEALTAAGPVVVWTKAALPSVGDWHQVGASLSAFGGQQIAIRLRFDTVDAAFNGGAGVFVDDVAVASPCVAAPCAVDAACDDGHATTADACVGGLCTHAPPDEPCAAGDPCDDGDPCTLDACVGAFCGHTRAPGCCVDAVGCWDGDPCTDDLCVGSPGTCANPASLSCCATAAQCGDGNPCTVGACPAGGGQCAQAWTPGCCIDASDCLDGDPCTDDRCHAGACVHVPACCGSDGDCDDGDPCTDGACADGQCAFSPTGAPGCCAPLLALPFTPPLGALASADNDPADGVGWSLTTEGCHSPGGCLRAADPATGTYETGGVVDVAVETPPFVVEPGATVGLWLRLANEWSGGWAAAPSHDVLSIAAVPDEGPSQLVWSSDAPDAPWWAAGAEGEILGPAWVHLTGMPLDDLDGQTVRLVVRFATGDALLNGFEGPTIDDLIVRPAGGCP